jgi:hypothetical protein
MERQRYLLTTQLDAIEQLTSLEPGKVNTQDPALLTGLAPGYWLEHDYVLTAENRLGWVWVLSTVHFPTDYRREQPWTARREIPAELARDILRLVGTSATG